jgi:hypothetical protein
MKNGRRAYEAPFQAISMGKVFEDMQENIALARSIQRHAIGDNAKDVFPSDALRRQLNIQGCG